MTDDFFFSDRTGEPTPRVREDIPIEVWRALVALIWRRGADGSLAREFPVQDCHDSPSAITGTDWVGFNRTLTALVPDLDGGPGLPEDRLPPLHVVLDVVDFVGSHIAQPTSRIEHRYFMHEHLVFDQFSSVLEGREQFRRDVDLLFKRNGIAFTLDDGTKVVRLGPPEARVLLSDFNARTGDTELDAKLLDATSRFLSRDPKARVDALEKLWDAFERLKTLELGGGKMKARSIQQLLDRAVPNSGLRHHIEAECFALTGIGNAFHIRHFEQDKEALPGPAAVDYLFTRLLALMAFLLRQTDRA